MLASIVIPTYNHLESDLKPCIQSLLACTDMSKVEVVISANGCTDGTEEWARSLGFKVVSSPGALGYAGAVNAGLKVATGEYIILLNNDCEMLDGSWIEKLLKPFLDDVEGRVGMTGPVKNFWGIHPFLIFFCVMFRRKLLDEIGLLDEAFKPGAGEDTDFCIKVGRAGYRIVQVQNDSDKEPMPISFPIYHKGSRTVSEIPNWGEIVDRNTKILEGRYSRFEAKKIDKNPKLEGSDLIDCIPQTGYCPNRCQECYYNNGFFRTLDEPMIPTLEEVGDKIVRVNSGHDSNLEKEKVLEVTAKYPKKFFNTSIPGFDFPGPVIYTVNGREGGQPFPLDVSNLMAVRFRVSTWNLGACDTCVEYFTSRGVPILLTFMRYKLYEGVKRIGDYQFRKHILNSYWCITKEAWDGVVGRYKDNPLVLVCGKEYGNSMCKSCNNCVRLYERKAGDTPAGVLGE